jgi:cyclic beta-1,2-glucan synthetase
MLGHGDRAFELYQMINPVTHALTPDAVATYKVEPYVVAADVYTAEGHLGRGGWTWYTGSAGWLYRAGIESILGLRLQGASLLLDPCIPTSWPRFELTYKHRSARYHITVENPRGVSRSISSITLDGSALPSGPARVPLVDDGATHNVSVILG